MSVVKIKGGREKRKGGDGVGQVRKQMACTEEEDVGLLFLGGH